VTYGSLTKKHLLPVFGSRPLASITPSEIGDCLSALEKRLAPESTRLCYHVLKMVLELAVDYELIETSPLKSKLHRPSYKKTVRRGAQSMATVKRILQEIRPEHQTACSLIAITGMRIGECLALQWRDLDFDASALEIAGTLWCGRRTPPKSRKSHRVIKLPAQMLNQLREHQEHSRFVEPTDFIFCHDDGSAFSADFMRRGVLYPAIKKAGVERVLHQSGFHLFRHAVGTRVYERTRDLKAVQELLGHSTIGITADVYVRPDSGLTSDATTPLAGELFDSDWVN